MANIIVIVGTRPEIIKMAPIIDALGKTEFSFIHTGQHHDYNLSLQFIKDLELPQPDESFVLRSSNPSFQIGEMVMKLHRILIRTKEPRVVISLADTNTAFAAGISAIKSRCKLVHVEAGLRSYDWRMPEEHNRIALDHISDLLLATTKYTRTNLIKENVHGVIHITGNTVIDAVSKNISTARIKSTTEIQDEDFALVTLHRAENVDNQITLNSLVNALIKSPIKMVFPLHPRTRMRLKMFKLYDKIRKAGNIHLIPPIGYFDFLLLMQKCKFLISDSGGIQEEVTSPLIRKQLLSVRKSTERQEAVAAGFVKVIGTREEHITNEIRHMIECKKVLPRKSPYGDGKAGEKIAKLLLSFSEKL